MNQVYSGRLTAASPSIDLAALGLLLGRICFAADFLLFGARKFSDPSIISTLIVAHHLPGELVYPAMFLQLVGGTCILLGLQTRFWSAAFVWFCIVAPSIFWLDNLENLTRDYAAAGGFLFLLLFGPGRLSLDATLRGTLDPIVRYIPAITGNVVLIERTMLIGRALIALPFLADVVKKLVHFGPQRALLESKGIPGDTIAVIMLIETRVWSRDTGRLAYAHRRGRADRAGDLQRFYPALPGLRFRRVQRPLPRADVGEFQESRRRHVLQGHYHHRSTDDPGRARALPH